MDNIENNHSEQDKVVPPAKRMAGIMLTIGVAVFLITSGTLLANVTLSLSTHGDEGVIKTEDINHVQPFETNSAETDESNQLRIFVSYGGENTPLDAVTPQYATTVAEETYKQRTAKAFTNRVFVSSLIDSDFARWYVSAEIEGGTFYCAVDMSTGKVIENSIVFEDSAVDWSWFDNWEKDAPVYDSSDF